MKSQFDKVAVIIVFVSALLLEIFFFVLPKKEYSENENRYLAKLPDISVEHIVDGSYMQSVKDYVTDQFPARDFFISLKTAFEESSGQKKINGIYLAKDGYLIGEYSEPKNTDRIVKTLAKFENRIMTANSDVNLRLMLVPSAVTILGDKLPNCARDMSQMETMRIISEGSGMETVAVANYLFDAANAQDIYYKTDHHWNAFGAYEGYRAYCDSLGINAAKLSDFNARTVTDDFHGTYSAKVNRFREKGDEIIIFDDPKSDIEVYYEDSGIQTDTLYNFEYLDKRDKYSLFLDNLHPLITISNVNSTTDRVLMLIKDSYANCVVPYLIHDFSEIIVFDTRYYKDGPGKYFEEHPEITDVLILYNMNTIDTDTGIRGIY